MKNILFATDLSNRSDRAFDRAIDIARNENAKLNIINVIDAELPSDIQKTLKEKALSHLKAQLKLKKFSECSIVVRNGINHDEIIDYANQLEAGLIILGIHRKHSAKDFVLGSTLERLLKHSNIPVLVVKNPGNTDYRNILVGVDISKHSKNAILFVTNNFKKLKKNFVHAYTIPFQGFIKDQDLKKYSEETSRNSLNELKEELLLNRENEELKNIKIDLIEAGLGVTNAIIEKASKCKADLLVIGTHDRSGLIRGIIGGTAIEILKYCESDILFVK
jgi:nucleotide-binding universal stress UspA family protein